MTKRFSHRPPACSIVETLESRTLLCGAAAASDPVGAVEQSAVVVAAKAPKVAATKTTLAVSTGTLGAMVTFTVTVRAPVAAGSPVGTVNIIDHKKVLQSLSPAPTTSTNPKFAYSLVTFTLTQSPGGSAYYFGRHAVSAAFVPTGAFRKSSGSKSFTVVKPTYTLLSDGVGLETVVAGSGPQIQSGQTASMFYTGYLAKNGHIFDDSVTEGGLPSSFQLGVDPLIAGFEEGALGMQAGETRIVYIPPAEGYGAMGSPPAIPSNAPLIFILTLVSIS